MGKKKNFHAEPPKKGDYLIIKWDGDIPDVIRFYTNDLGWVNFFYYAVRSQRGEMTGSNFKGIINCYGKMNLPAFGSKWALKRRLKRIDRKPLTFAQKLKLSRNMRLAREAIKKKRGTRPLRGPRIAELEAKVKDEEDQIRREVAEILFSKDG